MIRIRDVLAVIFVFCCMGVVGADDYREACMSDPSCVYEE